MSSNGDFRPNFVFQPSVFIREAMIEKWPHLHKVVASGDQIAAAFESIRKSPAWREDPRLGDISRETVEEVFDVYNHVVEDGRHIDDFLKSPREVAQRLGRQLSDHAVAVIGAAHQGLRSEEVPPPVAVGIAIVTVVVAVGALAINLAARGAGDAGGAGGHPMIIVDESGRLKLGSRSGAQ